MDAAIVRSYTVQARAAARRRTLAVAVRIEAELSALARETADLETTVEIGKSCRHVRQAIKQLETSE